MENRSNVDDFLLDISVEKLKNNKSYNEIKRKFLKYYPEFIEGYDTLQENQYHIYTVGEHTLYAIANSAKNVLVRWALVLHDIGKSAVKTYDDNGVAHFYLHHLKSMDIADKILSKYGFEDAEKELVLKLIKNHDREIKSKSAIRRLLKEMTIEEVLLLLEVKIGDANAQNKIYISDRIKSIDEIRKKLNEIEDENKRFKISELNITGKDIIALGISDGKRIGHILNTLYNQVIDGKLENTKEVLVEAVQKIE